MGREITVKVGTRELIFGEGVALPIDRIFVNHPDDSVAEIERFNAEQYPWITLWMHRFKDGVLDCEVSDFCPKSPAFGALHGDFSSVRKLSIFYDNPKLSKLAQIKVKRPPPEPLVKSRPALRPTPPVFPSVKPPREQIETITFAAPLAQFRFHDGYAEVDWRGHLPAARKYVRLCFRIENCFFSPKLNVLRPYLSRCLDQIPEVSATLRVCGEKVSIEKVEASALDKISSELLGQVRFNYVKGELKRRNGRRIATAERFFGELSEAGFGESDADFISDIVRAKNTRHAEHIEYLAGLHDGGRVRLRLIRDPFSFLFFVPGSSGSFFIWETFDGTDATYIWKVKSTAYDQNGCRSELKQAVRQVEQTLDYIYAAGRNQFLGETHDGFVRVFHDYQSDDGFEQWKQEVDRLVSGPETGNTEDGKEEEKKEFAASAEANDA
ncbi:MAG: hypothetical protein GXY61_08615 [Lentisphaerae bacterium]|jgi:hypothetical protein|nr:hypothetical protein [Lentisphaerota bacterium]